MMTWQRLVKNCKSSNLVVLAGEYEIEVTQNAIYIFNKGKLEAVVMPEKEVACGEMIDELSKAFDALATARKYSTKPKLAAEIASTAIPKIKSAKEANILTEEEYDKAMGGVVRGIYNFVERRRHDALVELEKAGDAIGAVIIRSLRECMR